MLTTSVHLYVLLFFATRIIYGRASCSCDQPDSKFATGINLLYYKCNEGANATIRFPIAAPQDLLDVLEDDKRTIIYIFGYAQSPQDENVQFIMKALCYGRTDNIVLLDWSKYSTGSYVTVFQRGEKVGSLFARSIRLLKDKGLDVSKLYIVAHSLGAHIAGYAGKCNNFVIPRITGLDPANPIFYPQGCYLTSNDAAWIDVIHTDMYRYGAFNNMGTAEYYANGGIHPQPGCRYFGLLLSNEDFCSHQRSVRLYAASKYHPNEFIATQCPSYTLYNTEDCKLNLQTGVGHAASNVPGRFYFKTGIV